MYKLRKIIIVCTIALILVFALQKGCNFYVEKKINTYLAPYSIDARLEKLNLLTLNYRGLTLKCKIKPEGKSLYLVPLDNNLIAKLLPDKIKIPLK